MNFLRSLVSHVHRPISKRNLNQKVVFQKHRVISRSYVSQTEAEDEMGKWKEINPFLFVVVYYL